MFHIISIYAFHSWNIFRLSAVPSRSNVKVRVYKCATCPLSDSAWHVTVKPIDPNDANSLWVVRDNPTVGHCPLSNTYLPFATTRLPCSCCKQRKKRKITDQLFFNVRWVQETVAKNPSHTIGAIDAEVIRKFSEHRISKDCLPGKGARQNAISQLRVKYIERLPIYYARLPQYLKEFSEKNQLSSVALQSDQDDQFYRLFVGFPIAHEHGKLTLPILTIDCFHYQCPSYDGIAIALTSRTGFGLSVVYAFGIIPTEDTNNISWFLQLCVLHGIDFNCALFTDQGPLLSAANAISQRFPQVKFNLMLCLQHLIRNIIHRFPDFKKGELKSALSSSVDNASSARNMDEFFFHIDTMVERFLDSSAACIQTVCDMTFYILRIDPCHWTVFANTPSFDKKNTTWTGGNSYHGFTLHIFFPKIFIHENTIRLRKCSTLSKIVTNMGCLLQNLQK